MNRCLILVCALSSVLSAAAVRSAVVRPNVDTYDYKKMEYGVIVHLDLQTFEPTYQWRDRWGYSPDPKVFNPTALDTDQWIATAAASGAKFVVFVAKHCSGFSLWPTKAHGFSVAASPWKDGKGDLVADVKASCEKYGLRFGLYASYFSNARFEVDNGHVQERVEGQVFRRASKARQDAYNRMYLEQVRELWTNYGELCEIWFDGGVPPVAQGGADVASLVRELQPNAVLQTSGSLPELAGRRVRHGGREDGRVAEPGFSASDTAMGGGGAIDGAEFCPLEAVFANRDSLRGAFQGGWFWHPDQDHTVRPVSELLACYYDSVGRNATFLLGMCIDNRGLVPEADRRVFEAFGRVVGRINALPRDTVSGTAPVLELPVTKNAEVSEVLLREDFREGEKIGSYVIDAHLADGGWKTVATGRGIGNKRLVRFPRVATDRLRLTVKDGEAGFRITEFSAYFRRPPCPAPVVRRNDACVIAIDPIPEAEIRYTLDGSVPTAESTLYTGPIVHPEAGTVRAAAFPLEGDDPLFPELADRTVTTLAFGMKDRGWRPLDDANRYDDYNYPTNMLSSDCPHPWITSKTAGYPHAQTVDMLETREMRGFLLTPLWNKGIFKRYAFYVGDRPDAVTTLVAEGTFPDIGNMPVQQRVEFARPVRARYYKIVALEPWESTSIFASIGRLEIF